MVGEHRLRPDGPKAPARWVPWVIAVAVVLALAAGWWITSQSSTAQDDKVVAETQRDATAQQAGTLADQVAQACAAGGATADELQRRGACQQAAQVQTTPVPAVPGVDGLPGKAGRGITGTRLDGGHLLVSYTDGTTDDVGTVTGATGTAGLAGRGITGSTIEGGRLVLSFDDGTRTDLGRVVGGDGVPGAAGQNGQDGVAGRSVTSVAQVDGRLIVTFSDNTTQDAGPLPAGPAGTPAPSVQSVTKTYSDGATENCTRSGGSDTDPQFACTTTDPAPSEDPGPGGLIGG